MPVVTLHASSLMNKMNKYFLAWAVVQADKVIYVPASS